MILNFLNELNKRSIILASSSPRRREILEKLGIHFVVVPSLFEENLNPSDFSHPKGFVAETAKGKAKEVVERISSTNHPLDLVIGADTCVTLEGEVFGKPRDEAHAIDMLKKLSGRNHEVITGVCLMAKTKDSDWVLTEFSETTTVKFAPLSDDLIKSYVNTKEPMDKAGGYGIQAIGGSFIEGISGDFYNVMGFPLHRFTTFLMPILEKWGNNK